MFKQNLICRLCATSQVYYSETTKSISCETNCAAQTKCGDYITIPEEHLDVRYFFFSLINFLSNFRLTFRLK